MKPQQMKNAFARINEEAGKDENLSLAVASRAGTEKIAAPIQAVKALLKQFLIVIVPALLVYLTVSMVQIDFSSSLPEVEAGYEMAQANVMHNRDILANTTLVTLWFIRGVMRGFILLAVLTFILTAAAMPVHRSDENTGGSPCVA